MDASGPLRAGDDLSPLVRSSRAARVPEPSEPYAPISARREPADRRPAVLIAFYQDVLGLPATGAPADDGVPEPLQFVLHDGARLMLVPRGGFGWVIGDHTVAPVGNSECVLSLRAGTQAGVNDYIARAQQAGGEVVAEPAQRPWGYTGTFADPDGHLWMVTAEAAGA